MAKAILFRNWTTEDFTHTWNSVEYDFPAGSDTRLEESLANHFAKHLTDRELLKVTQMKDGKEEQLPVDHFTRPTYLKKCFPESEAIEARNEVDLQIKMDNPESKPKKQKVEEEINPAFK